ncbi:Disease resistance protein RPM1 [Vitis vinifera]|uniref:Disease resistance protein RPM1 n=1 Tax=Vitis vinifera TaxID=29760 RepID=A0A438J1B5_VITVI|nr:Disease resistance protein RPM1 [Vitis vinifera]
MKLSYSKVDPWCMGSFNKGPYAKLPSNSKVKRKSMNPDLAGGWQTGLCRFFFKNLKLLQVQNELAGKYQEWSPLHWDQESVWRHLKMWHSISNLIQDINTRLAIIKQTKERYQIIKEINERYPMMVPTNSVSSETNTYHNVRAAPLILGWGNNTMGIDEPKRKLVSWASKSNQKLKVMFLVGMAGLARQRLPTACTRRGVRHSSSHAETAQFSPSTNDGNDNRIIITTRRGDIANSCRDDSIDIHKVQPLSLQWAEQLFYKKAFLGDGSCPSGLEEVSKSILQKCDGLPLGIIEIGRGLAEYYESVFLASYKDLPYHLKYCFLYMSIFPENNPVKRRRLIRLWIAEGFVTEERGKTLEEVGEEYLNELIGRSLIKANEMDFDGRPITVGVHSLMHRIILSVSQEENFCTVCAGPEGNLTDKPRRLSIQTGNFDVSQDLTCVRTFFSFSTGRINIGSNFKLLKVLDIQSTPLGNFPKCHYRSCALEVLEFEEYKYKEHPKSLRNLRHLETLDLKQTLVTKGFKAPKGIDALKNLQKAIICKGEWAAQNDTRARQSYAMPNLHSLNVTSLNKEELLELDAMTNPPPPSSTLVPQRAVGKVSTVENPIGALQNLPNLTELQLLDAYTGTQLDFNSGKFQKLKILDLEQLKQLRFIIMEDGTLPCLQKLIIRQCNELEHVPVGIDGLHHLNELHLCDMPEKLVAQLKKNGGQFRHLVHHIPYIHSYNQGQLERSFLIIIHL